VKVDISIRKMSRAERDLLRQGRRAEAEGTADGITQATICYKRIAFKNGLDAHLAKLFLAALYFRQDNYVHAVGLYDNALAIMREKNHEVTSLYYQQDSFLVHFNR